MRKVHSKNLAPMVPTYSSPWLACDINDNFHCLLLPSQRALPKCRCRAGYCLDAQGDEPYFSRS